MNKVIEKIKKYYWWFFSILLISACAIYFTMTKDTFVWYDESYTFAMIKHSFSEIWKITAADVHPPLYYFLLKIFTSVFTQSLLSAKIFSIIPYLIIMVFGGVQLKNFYGKKSSLLFMLFFLSFPALLGYVAEVRMYSLAALFVFVNAVYGYRCIKCSRISDWFLFSLFGACAAYTHYFALVSVGIVYIILLVAAIMNKTLKKWFIAAGVTVLLYLPWLGCFIEQLAFKVNNEYWIAPITMKSILSYLYFIFGAEKFPKFWLIALLLYFGVFVYTLLKKNKNDSIIAFCLMFIPFGTIAIGVLASVLIRPVFVIRYIIPSLPFFPVFLAIFVPKLKSRCVTIAFLIFALIGGTINYVNKVDDFDLYENALNRDILSKYSDSDCYVVLTKSLHFSAIVSYYETEKPIYRLRPISKDDPYLNVEHVDDFEPGKYEDVVLIIDVDKESDIPKEYLEKYNISYERDICEYEKNAKLYLMTKK